MAGWNGAGVFTVPYTFVQDAANGIKILASRQDTQWATVVAGFMNCQTLDGQNKPTANWDFNGKKIINLGAPSVATDVARLGDIASQVNEWPPETNAFTFNNTTSFKLTGANLTSKYTPGRRLKIVHNSGGTTSYYTVVSSSFSTDTTVNVNGPNLVSTLTSVSFSINAADHLSQPALSAISIIGSQSAVNTTSFTVYTIGTSQFPIFVKGGDIYSEFSGGIFTPKVAGVYFGISYFSFIKNGATIQQEPTASVGITASGSGSGWSSLSASSDMLGWNSTGQANLAAITFGGWYLSPPSDTLTFSVRSPQFTGGPVQANTAYALIYRLSTNS